MQSNYIPWSYIIVKYFSSKKFTANSCQYLRYAEGCGKDAEFLYDRTDTYIKDTKNQNMQHLLSAVVA